MRIKRRSWLSTVWERAFARSELRNRSFTVLTSLGLGAAAGIAFTLVVVLWLDDRLPDLAVDKWVGARKKFTAQRVDQDFNVDQINKG